MNRHMRRAANKGSLGELSGMTEQLQLYLANIEQLKSQLDNVMGLLLESEREMVALRIALVEQRHVYRHLFARGMGVSLDTVLSMESEIQTEINQGDQDVVKTPSANPGPEA